MCSSSYIDQNGMFAVDVLKIIALVTMFIDHIGAGILEYAIQYRFNGDIEWYRKVLEADHILRCIGRISFPIYCYLLVQGFFYTRNRGKYALRMFVFALISELPFDFLFFSGFTWKHQNVFWTLLIALITLILIDHLEHLEKLGEAHSEKHGKNLMPVLLKSVTVFFAIGTGMLVAHFLRTDYSWKGVLLITAIYLTRSDRLLQTFLPPTLFLGVYFLEYVLLGYTPGTAFAEIFGLQWTIFLSFLLMYRCNGRKVMKKGKYFFYLFYPAHILLLLFVRFLLFL